MYPETPPQTPLKIWHQPNEDNYQYFKTILPDILHIHQGKYALLQNRQVLAYYDTLEDALMTAHAFCAEDGYSIQEVTDRVVDLGYFSHVHPIA